ncbi:hypothetical protein NG895_22590 [Aeoliella sp. ICT_H6.2]|uniref:Uncharacterized protein n=1 Tax=Aeoliella straminimaris TaxID=2954799 RepID=A0A9X2JKJ4_9BACT|nr:hypothetical protein [Aeoliella straminimaris]MCO6046694.1 hypothetical protein [Aeoliella straminimaris]
MSRITQLFFAGFAMLAIVVWAAMPANAEEVTLEVEADSPAAAEAPCTEAKCPACEDGTCTGEDCPLKATTVAASSDKPVISAAESEAELGTPTHRQVKIIKANQEGLSNTKLNCFCMTLDGRILAGCGSSKDNGEIRVFNSDGDYVETWSTPVKVEAINVRANDGHVFVAGDGRLVQLDDTGSLIADKPSPHASVSKEQAAKMRQAVIDQLTSRVKLYQQQAKIYDQQIELIGAQVEKLQTKLDELPAAEEGTDEAAEGEEADSESAVASRTRAMFEKQLTQLERSKGSLERTKELWNKRIEQLGDAEPSEEDIQRQIESQVSRKLAVASISAVDDQVYIACSAAVGYGYSVWAISDDFASGEEIIGDLRGCCGQMDVQVNDHGIYVAENSRDRVVCFDHKGEEVTHWGHSAREGIRGFGSCCNPMNVAFGPEHTVYTAESGTGRIKQYTSDGQLLQVVGSADLVPGCKKVSIGVSSDGNRVFMLDITRDHIVMMDRIPAEERKQMVAKAQADDNAANSDDTDEAAGEKPVADKVTQLKASQPIRVRAAAIRAIQVQPAIKAVPAQ